MVMDETTDAAPDSTKEHSGGSENKGPAATKNKGAGKNKKAPAKKKARAPAKKTAPAKKAPAKKAAASKSAAKAPAKRKADSQAGTPTHYRSLPEGKPVYRPGSVTAVIFQKLNSGKEYELGKLFEGIKCIDPGRIVGLIRQRGEATKAWTLTRTGEATFKMTKPFKGDFAKGGLDKDVAKGGRMRDMGKGKKAPAKKAPAKKKAAKKAKAKK